MKKDKFKCTNKKCQECCDCIGEQEDNRLQLIVETKNYQKFDIGIDGTLDNCDGDSEQEIFLQCPICGVRYKFEVDENEFVLEVVEKYVMSKFILGKVRYGQTDVVDLSELQFKQINK